MGIHPLSHATPFSESTSRFWTGIWTRCLFVVFHSGANKRVLTQDSGRSERPGVKSAVCAGSWTQALLQSQHFTHTAAQHAQVKELTCACLSSRVMSELHLALLSSRGSSVCSPGCHHARVVVAAVSFAGLAFSLHHSPLCKPMQNWLHLELSRASWWSLEATIERVAGVERRRLGQLLDFL